MKTEEELVEPDELIDQSKNIGNSTHGVGRLDFKAQREESKQMMKATGSQALGLTISSQTKRYAQQNDSSLESREASATFASPGKKKANVHHTVGNKHK